MSYTLLVPQIDAVSITPNPVNQNAAFLIAITVSEIEQILEPILIYSGTFYAGETEVL
jgi:hypothetical protein